MNIGLTTVAWNNYARFIPEWCEYIAKSTIKPDQVTVVLGKDHGLTEKQEQYCRELVPDILFIESSDPKPNIGKLTNLAIANTPTEWIMPFDVDDLLLPDALETLAKFEEKADYLCIAWKVLWGGKTLYRASPIPKYLASLTPKQRSKRRINNNSPFRRKFWEIQKYDENNYMNLQFLAFLVEKGARFVQVRRACIVYRQWEDSMAKSGGWSYQRTEMVKSALNMYDRLKKYYER